MEKEERFLPIGTVVLLKGGKRELMITSYCIMPSGEVYDKNGKVENAPQMYDYGACKFPEGVMDSKTGIGFNHSDIEEVIHMGCKDDDYKNLNSLLKKHAETLKAEYKKNQFKKLNIFCVEGK